MRRNVVINLLLVLGIVLIVGAALMLDAGRSGDEERFVGTDSAATSKIEEDHPDYVPWFESVFSPTSGEVESGLFALQAALGGLVLGYVLAALRGRRKLDALRTELERT
ncbi:energy-coupling factor ABC transporter substrate-binding protein [Rhodococcus sp. BP-149]|uniref:energy-coupling factor ABC transporter substrate-binding protein n=1 Tax=unclassified Rhodococcus (in: high G+C Gram-positive bacteria) TaxID=192944 RepID=UPI001C9A2D9A|nr:MULTISPECIES: energy-coupling factor ABC transporter substrate-binding protein [unclassified Rhodococcus (in: high G+C Gram-positive bacteria)]MBY6686651.1 energy-coupling factor ABC transporter substrate-binding protein [Rhodococcus sp. BP-288]MBY6695361.1 energy-coupling factor ABC transporter substrate-binding protein [Rhodococcus sp. BP-188]MBY6700143.1 energy-coupling factor ABC transporter substrate-binding protein [Rhodococcus sp. BP-285]MBY6704834.1 energy-coupling factor ABC transpo